MKKSFDSENGSCAHFTLSDKVHKSVSGSNKIGNTVYRTTIPNINNLKHLIGTGLVWSLYTDNLSLMNQLSTDIVPEYCIFSSALKQAQHDTY